VDLVKERGATYAIEVRVRHASYVGAFRGRLDGPLFFPAGNVAAADVGDFVGKTIATVT